MRIAVPVAACLAALAATPAAATGGLSCDASDKAVDLSVESGVTRGMGGPLLDFKASLSLKLKGVPEDLRKLEFAHEHLPHHWLGNRDIRLRLYREREGNALPHASVEVEILTRQVPKEEDSYRGTYAITVHVMPDDKAAEPRTLTARGRVACFTG